MSDQRPPAPEKGELSTTEYIRKYAGKFSTDEMALALGITSNGVRSIASKHQVSLSVTHLRVGRPAGTLRAPAKPKQATLTTEATDRDTLERRIDAASRLLRSQGWTVLRPDPFRTIHRERSA